MYEQEKIKPYGKEGDKTMLVEAMFNNIAPTYDTLNHRLSWNIDKSWRKRAIKRLIPYKPQKILDVATGTGDFALLAAKELQEKRSICSSITGIDISAEMLSIADGKNKAKDYGIDFHKDDCMNLSFADCTFDAVIAAFGIRNFSDLERGLSEMCRVLKNGGHLCILELTRPVSFPMKQLFLVYSHTFLPVYGKLVSKDRSAYEYLTATIEAFPQGEQMVGILRKAGFSTAGFKRMTFGICTMYFAEK